MINSNSTVNNVLYNCGGRWGENLFGDTDVLTLPYSIYIRVHIYIYMYIHVREVNKWLCEILARAREFVGWCCTLHDARNGRLMFLKTLFRKVMRFEWPWKMCALFKRVDEQLVAGAATRPQRTRLILTVSVRARTVCVYMYIYMFIRVYVHTACVRLCVSELDWKRLSGWSRTFTLQKAKSPRITAHRTHSTTCYLRKRKRRRSQPLPVPCIRRRHFKLSANVRRGIDRIGRDAEERLRRVQALDFQPPRNGIALLINGSP